MPDSATYSTSSPPSKAPTVSDYMTTRVIDIPSNAGLRAAADRMRRERVRALIARDPNGGLSGILTATDLLSAQCGDAPNELRVDDAMTRNLDLIAPTSPLSDAARLMVGERFHHLPVVDNGGTVVGMLSASDLADRVADAPGLPATSVLMSRDLVSIGHNAPATDALGYLKRGGIHLVLVTQDGRTVGMVTRFSLLEAELPLCGLQTALSGRTAAEVATSIGTALSEDTPCRLIARRFHAGRAHHVLVHARHTPAHVIGVITPLDLVAWLATQAPRAVA